MKTLTVALPGREYDILIQRGLLDRAEARAGRRCPGQTNWSWSPTAMWLPLYLNTGSGQPEESRVPGAVYRHPRRGGLQMRRAVGPPVGEDDGLRPHPHRRGRCAGRRRGGGPGGLCRCYHPAGGGLCSDPHHPAGPGGLLGGGKGGHRPERGQKPGRRVLSAQAGADGPGGAGHPAGCRLLRRHGGGHQIRLYLGPGVFQLPDGSSLPAGGDEGDRVRPAHLLRHQAPGGPGGRAGHRPADDPEFRTYGGPRL